MTKIAIKISEDLVPVRLIRIRTEIGAAVVQILQRGSLSGVVRQVSLEEVFLT